MPRRGGSGGKWFTKSGGKSVHKGKGRGRVKTKAAPKAGGSKFPQVRGAFRRMDQPDLSLATLGPGPSPMPRRKRNGSRRHVQK